MVSAGVVSTASFSTSCVVVTQYTAPIWATKNRDETSRNAVSVTGKSGLRFGMKIAVTSAQAMNSAATTSRVTLPVVVIE